jgi:hypothetical protein
MLKGSKPLIEEGRGQLSHTSGRLMEPTAKTRPFSGPLPLGFPHPTSSVFKKRVLAAMQGLWLLFSFIFY